MTLPDEVKEAVQLSIAATAEWFNDNVDAVNSNRGDRQFDTCLSICGEKYVHSYLFEQLRGDLPRLWKPFREVKSGLAAKHGRVPPIDLAVSQDPNPEFDIGSAAGIELKVGYLAFDDGARGGWVPAEQRDKRKSPGGFREALKEDAKKLKGFGAKYLVVLGYFAWRVYSGDMAWWAQREAAYEGAVRSMISGDLSIWWNSGFV